MDIAFDSPSPKTPSSFDNDYYSMYAQSNHHSSHSSHQLYAPEVDWARPPSGDDHSVVYCEPLSVPRLEESYDFSVKLEDPSNMGAGGAGGIQPLIVPSQHHPYFHHHQHSGGQLPLSSLSHPSSLVGVGLGGAPNSNNGNNSHNPHGMGSQGGMSMYAHGPIPIQHTDDAASKETQYLRRRCFNCHTTEPPSWRRSTLNPGKIVCNKCGLYERTHLRPRPHRFDELRAGNKARKHSAKLMATGGNGGSPKESEVKKEPSEYDFDNRPSRRGSVSSSSVHSASSDFDDNVSVYSSTGSLSGTGSSYNSPLISSFSIPRLSPSLSPPMTANSDSHGSMGASPPLGHHSQQGGPIRLPNAPLCDIASLHSAPNSPRKASTVPVPSYSHGHGHSLSNGLGLGMGNGLGLGSGSGLGLAAGQMQSDYFSARRGSLPVMYSNNGIPQMPECTGWQTVSMGGEDVMIPPLSPPTLSSSNSGGSDGMTRSRSSTSSGISRKSST